MLKSRRSSVKILRVAHALAILLERLSNDIRATDVPLLCDLVDRARFSGSRTVVRSMGEILRNFGYRNTPTMARGPYWRYDRKLEDGSLGERSEGLSCERSAVIDAMAARAAEAAAECRRRRCERLVHGLARGPPALAGASVARRKSMELMENQRLRRY
jgi:hypothetical protein